jgi:hypothetical protein
MVKVRFFVLRGTSCAFISTLRVYCEVKVQLYRPLLNKREFRDNQRCDSHTSGLENGSLKKALYRDSQILKGKYEGKYLD